MQVGLVIFMCFWAAVVNGMQEGVELQGDQPFQRVAVSQKASIQCCYRCEKIPHVTWIKNVYTNNGTTIPRFVNLSDDVTAEPMTEKNDMKREKNEKIKCHELILKKVHLEDTGLYQCYLNLSSPRIAIFTHGTFLQVYKPMQKTLNLSESVKNSIITAEGVLLLLCVLIPGTMLLCKSKSLNELERRKGREEENIYEGLNLDDCNSAYHQIQRAHVQGPYQDVANCGDDIQLEKP